MKIKTAITISIEDIVSENFTDEQVERMESAIQTLRDIVSEVTLARRYHRRTSGKLENKMKLLEDRFGHKAGTTIYEFAGHDYGCRSQDEFYTQKPHMVVTLDPDGDGPFFTVPTEEVE